MTTINIATIATTATTGRPVNKTTKELRQRIINLLRRNSGEEMTTNFIAKSIKQSKQKVVAQLRWLENQKVIAKVGTAKVTQGVGRPSAIWATTEGTRINEVKQQKVRRLRAFTRLMAEMTAAERKAFVHSNLKALNERQVDEEQEVKESLYRNAQGFTAYDAKRGMLDAEKDELALADVNYWLKGRRIYKYALQLDI